MTVGMVSKPETYSASPALKWKTYHAWILVEIMNVFYGIRENPGVLDLHIETGLLDDMA